MLERFEIQDPDAGKVIAFRDTRSISVDVSVSRFGIIIRGAGRAPYFHAFALYSPERVDRVPYTPTLGPLVAIARQHLAALRGERGAQAPSRARERRIFRKARARR
jgi:hypothetical protein